MEATRYVEEHHLRENSALASGEAHLAPQPRIETIAVPWQDEWGCTSARK